MSIMVIKNTDGLYTVLWCSRCKKIVFYKTFIPEDKRRYHIFRCCECEEKLEYLDVEVDSVEIEISRY